MIRHGKNDHRIRFEMRDRIQETLKHLESKYGHGWMHDKKALADPKLLMMQLWMNQHADFSIFDEPDYQEIYQLRMQGKRPTEIARITGFKRSFVTSKLRVMKEHHKLDDAPNYSGQTVKPKRFELLELVKKGYNKSAIGKVYGVSARTVYEWLRKDKLIKLSQNVIKQKKAYIVIKGDEIIKFKNCDECCVGLNISRQALYHAKNSGEKYHSMTFMSEYDYIQNGLEATNGVK